MKNKFVKILLSSTAISSLAMIAPCFSSCTTNVNEIKSIDGTDWEGLNVGSFAENDYDINVGEGTITYFKSVGIHAFNLVIPNYVSWNETKLKVLLGEECFKDNNGISGNVELNDFIREIPKGCFQHCPSLTGIIFHKKPTLISDYAFCNSVLLSQIYVLQNRELITDWESDLRYVGAFAFYKCIALDGDFIPGTNLLGIGEFAFSQCEMLKLVNLQFCHSLTYLDKGVFSSCGIRRLFLSPSMTSIGDEAFKWCTNLEWIKVPIKGMELALGNHAFYHCDSLETWTDSFRVNSIGEGCFAFDKKLTFPIWLDEYGIETIADSAFASCGMTSIKFKPSGVQDVGDYAFSDNNNLNFIDFSEYKPEDGIPKWQGAHIFDGASDEGTILLNHGNKQDVEWLNFLEDNGLKVLEGKWKVITPQMPIKYITAPYQHGYVLEMDESGHGTLSITGFRYVSIGDFDKNNVHTYFHLKDSSGVGVKLNPIITWDTKEQTFSVDVEVNDETPRLCTGYLCFYYLTKKIDGQWNNFSIDLRYE